jgi:hypothetical protein
VPESGDGSRLGLEVKLSRPPMPAPPEEASASFPAQRDEQSCIDQQRVDRIVASHIPALWTAVSATRVMLQGRMRDLMGQDTGELCRAKCIHEVRVEE